LCVSISGLFLTCSIVTDAGSVRLSQFGTRTEIGEIRTVRPRSHDPVSTTR